MKTQKTKGFYDRENDTVHIFIPPTPTESERGGITAKEKTTESLEVAIDSATGKAYVALDKTLSKTGEAADAAVVGEKLTSMGVTIENVKEDLNNLINNNELFSRVILDADLHSYVMKNGVEYEIPIEGIKGAKIGAILYTKDYNLIKITLESIRCNRRELEHLPFDNTLKIIDFGEIIPGYKPKERIKLFEYVINQGYSSASEASSVPIFGGDNNLYYETDGHLRLSYYTWASPTSDKPYLFTSYKIFSTIYQ